MGTAQYLSPEQARGAPVTAASDLYSAGVVLYEMLTGKMPFTGDSPIEIAMKHLNEVPQPPSELRAGHPAGARPDRPARARQGSARPLPDGRGVQRRPRAGRGRPADLALDRHRRHGHPRRRGRRGGDRAALREPDARRGSAACAATASDLPAQQPVRRASAEAQALGALAARRSSSSPRRSSPGGGSTTRFRTSSRPPSRWACRTWSASSATWRSRRSRRQSSRSTVEEQPSTEVEQGLVIEQHPAGRKPHREGRHGHDRRLDGPEGGGRSRPWRAGRTSEAVDASWTSWGSSRSASTSSRNARSDRSRRWTRSRARSSTKAPRSPSGSRRGRRRSLSPTCSSSHEDSARASSRPPGSRSRSVEAPSSSTVARGSSSAQNPDPGVEAARGSTVQITISTGPEQIRVPDVDGPLRAGRARRAGGAGLRRRGRMRRESCDPARSASCRTPTRSPTRSSRPARPWSSRSARPPARSDAIARLRVAVLMGGRSSEHEISLARRARSIEGSTRSATTSLPVEIPREGAVAPRRRGQARRAIDVVFPVLHGPFGEDGTVQGAPRARRTSPTSAPGVTASALCMDKDLFKSVMRDKGIPVARAASRAAATATRSRARSASPSWSSRRGSGSSVGISVVRAAEEDFAAAVELAFAHDEKILVEEFVRGRRGRVQRARERRSRRVDPGRDRPARERLVRLRGQVRRRRDGARRARRGSPRNPLARVQELAVASFVASDCEGMARVDFFVRPDGEVVVNELNTIPGFTATSVYAKLFEASGIAVPAAPRPAGRARPRAPRPARGASLLDRRGSRATSFTCAALSSAVIQTT